MARLHLLLAVLLAAVVVVVSASPNPHAESKAALCCRKRPSLPRSFSHPHLPRDLRFCRVAPRMWLLRSQVLSPAEVEAEAVLPPAAATAAAPEEEGLLPEAAS